MKTFENVHFNGVFRSYQENVLKRAKKYINDRKIHIVAAPGSGKTILGLEIIRRINARAMIFSPSITIRQQWGERFEEKFISEDDNINEYFSYDIKKPSLITSVTYQALHAAMNKLNTSSEVPTEDSDDVFNEDVEHYDYTNFDLIKTIKDNKITTICLDEAHHLRSEWQKSLEELIKILDQDITIVALTATPPYDSAPNEWKKYTTICGDIDDEIFVPELVAQNTLCPHQDYIFFNYPTDDEILAIKKYRNIAIETLAEITYSVNFKNIIRRILDTYKTNIFYMQENSKGYVAILTLAKMFDYEVSEEIIIAVSPTDRLVEFSYEIANQALQFIIEHSDIYETDAKEIKKKLSEKGLIERKKVCLSLNEKLRKLLLASGGKLKSIASIVQNETEFNKNDLRLLILTDYIKKETLKYVGTNRKSKDISVVSIFEQIRTTVDPNIKAAVLSGSLVILNNDIIEETRKLAARESISCIVKKLVNTNFSEVIFSSNNKSKVKIITELFTRGLITTLIGTKSLLGEGWDSPSINTIILASFVGTYMLSNQMRGRAIRIDKNNENKAANIWHLATIEPTDLFDDINVPQNALDKLETKEIIHSSDFETLTRRFDCFLAPAYGKDTIESGIERLSVIHPPYDKEGYTRITKETLELAKNRDQMVQQWKRCLEKKEYAIAESVLVPDNVYSKSMLRENIIYIVCSFILMLMNIALLIYVRDNIYQIISVSIVLLILVLVMMQFILRAFRLTNSNKMTTILSKCILKSLIDIKEIQSSNVTVKVTTIEDKNYCSIINATRHEQAIFAKALTEFFSPIDNPRYILVRRNSYGIIHKYSYSVPTILGNKKSQVEILKKLLCKKLARVEIIYTRNMNGKLFLLKCIHTSYLNKQNITIGKLKILTN